MSPKELKKLATACRKAGIKHFKNAEVEFTLADNSTITEYRPSKKVSVTNLVESPSDIDASLTDEALLMWSVGGDPSADKES